MRLAVVKTCAFCGAHFETKNRAQIFCSWQHSRSAARRDWRHRKYAARDTGIVQPVVLRKPKAKTEPAYYKKAPRVSEKIYVPIGFEKEFGQDDSAWI